MLFCIQNIYIQINWSPLTLKPMLSVHAMHCNVCKKQIQIISTLPDNYPDTGQVAKWTCQLTFFGGHVVHQSLYRSFVCTPRYTICDKKMCKKKALERPRKSFVGTRNTHFLSRTTGKQLLSSSFVKNSKKLQSMQI